MARRSARNRPAQPASTPAARVPASTRFRYHWLGVSIALLGLLLVLLMLQLWLTHTGPIANAGEGFAADRDNAGGSEKEIPFDGQRAMEYLETICKIGPRISGSEGMKKQQKLLEQHFKDLGATVTYQRFTAKQKSQRQPVEMANLIVSYHPEKRRRVILCCHYDTRPIADQEYNPRRWHEPFLSANDGGSGVALLMELARHMKELDLQVGVDFVFFDGEEYIYEPDRDLYFFGSKHFAQEYTRQRRKTITYTGAILLDMIAGKNASFPIEQNSWLKASRLVKEVWGIAAELKCDTFKDGFSRFAVDDDHIPLNNAGIPAIDIIDFDYPHWHRLSDIPKNCAPEPMEQVGRVCGVWIQRAR